MHLRISRVMQNAMRAITHDTWRLKWFVGQLYRFQCTGAYDVNALAGLFRLTMVFAKRACVRMRARNRFSHTNEVKVQYNSLDPIVIIETTAIVITETQKAERRHQRVKGNFPSRKRSKRSKEKEEGGGGRKGGQGGARQAGEQAFSVHRKISQPGRGPMPVNSVGRSLTSSNSNGYATGFFTVCQEALARGVHSPDAAIRNRKEASRGRHDSSRFPYEKLRRNVEKFTVKHPLKQRYLPEKEIEKAASCESCHVAKNIILKMWFLISWSQQDAKDHSSNKIAQVTTTSVLWWQRTFDDVGHKNRLRAPSTLRYEAPISGC
ncbi:hypothetical protein ALC53_05403 [Atta colombica]|uniref:Uncharacterized protein n=1 Tax=Atta colombica TaxID=520822 RepID=A0A195BHN0_9HYME|nr:hypothetical protein ALC53_05403 [Atta colombica]